MTITTALPHDEVLGIAPDEPSRWESFKQPRPLEAVLAELPGPVGEEGRRDVCLTDLRDWRFGRRLDDALVLVPPRGASAGLGALTLRHTAFTQLCQRLGIPAPYVAALPAELALRNLDHGLRRAPSRVMARLVGDEIRAVLGTRYTPFDDADVVRIAMEQLAEVGSGLKVRAWGSGRHLVLRLTTSMEAREARRGDVIECGVDIANSELGLRSLEVVPITYRLLCTNGMRQVTRHDATRLRHVGDPSALGRALIAALGPALERARWQLDLWRRAPGEAVADGETELRGLRRLRLTAADVAQVRRELLSERAARDDDRSGGDAEDGTEPSSLDDFTVFEFANAITATARQQGDIGRRLALEEAGYRYLEQRVA